MEARPCRASIPQRGSCSTASTGASEKLLTSKLTSMSCVRLTFFFFFLLTVRKEGRLHCLDDFEQSNNTAMLVPNTNTRLTYLLTYLLTYVQVSK